MTGPSTSAAERLSSKAANAHGPCSFEANWIVSRPEFEGSARLKSLLLYIAKRSDATSSARISQLDIACDVMGFDRSYDPSCDAHVRIEVARLRSALCGFYSRLQQPRSRRLSVPKGRYKAQLDTVQQDKLLGKDTGTGTDPKIAIGTLCSDDDLSRRYGFEMECEILTLMSDSALMADELISFHCVEATTLEAMVQQAQTAGACMLLVTRVMASEDRVDAYLSVIDPWDQRLIENIKLSSVANATDSHDIARSAGAQAIDPINGRVLQQIFRLYPDSRIARLADVFAFMGNQDRSLLPRALAAAQSMSQTSDIARALTIDMTRASYCFGTDPYIRDMASTTDAAEKLVEQSPNCISSQLAMGYVGISNDRRDLVGRAVSSLNSSTLLGAQQADYNLLQTLYGADAGNHDLEPASTKPMDQSVFDTIRMGYAAVRDRTNDAANDGLHTTKHKNVFWIQAFRVSAFSERGQHQQASEVFGQMKQAHPGIANYMHRAVSTMIPDVDLRGRMLAGLDRASQ